MDAVVDELVEKKSLTKQEFFGLVELHGSLKPMPPSIIDIRVAICQASSVPRNDDEPESGDCREQYIIKKEPSLRRSV